MANAIAASLSGLKIEGCSRAGTPFGDDDSPLIKSTEDVSIPRLVHKWKNSKSVLSLAVSDNYLFAGTEGNVILVYDLEYFQEVAVLKGHGGSILSLHISNKKRLLFSAGSDSILKIWDTETLQELYSVYSVYDIGDIFAVQYSESLQTVFLGCQNASIQWCDLTTIDRHTSADKSHMPGNRFNKFFNSTGPGGNQSRAPPSTNLSVAKALIELPYHNVVPYAHNGYVYCLINYRPSTHIATSSVEENRDTLLSGGGDGIVNWWVMREGKLVKSRSFANQTSVLSMTAVDTFLYCGLTDGAVAIWDLDAGQLIRSIQAHKADVLSISALGSCIFSGSATGYIRKWSREMQLAARWESHDGLILSTIGVRRGDRALLFTGGNDNSVVMWDITDAFPELDQNLSFANDQLLASLSTFVSFRTISGSLDTKTECRRCASYLKRLLRTYGATAELITTDDKHNPVVYGRFSANSEDKSGSTVLFYGHYDIVAASDDDRWESDPYLLSGRNGYLHGRGVSDNKGPILAAVFAAAELYQEKKLNANVVFLIEGEEESGSVGFQTAVEKSRAMIEPDKVDWVVLSNSYWLDDKTPCLNYGLRGLIHLTVEISSDLPDLHSGVDGGIHREPLMDMTKLLSKLTDDDGRVNVPGFYEPVRPITDAEEALYEQIVKNTSIHLLKDQLMARWRLPSLTIHAVQVARATNQTIIPHKVTATLSVRTVPDQDTDTISTSLQGFLVSEFGKFSSPNHLSIKLNKRADAWLGNPENDAFKTLAGAVTKAWDIEPLYIREGGTIPAVRYLEKIFDAPAAQLPCGQSSDHAHLDNERIRVVNLYNAKSIWKATFNELPPRTTSS
ncbi:hypothetical protein BZA70DRAFT_281398 [Myxozyma melibiosi]|uniref:Peptidase M20 dimerisation domain-containing protein n=1 Tax=Myxozyma melibiosi TaxID=54550 RepID=A0ABR1F4J8_9ASCO